MADLSPLAQQCFGELCRWTGGSATTPDIMERQGLTRTMAKRGLSELAEAGLVTARRKGGQGHGRATWWKLTAAGLHRKAFGDG